MPRLLRFAKCQDRRPWPRLRRHLGPFSSSPGRLNFDDIGAEVGEDHAARARDELARSTTFNPEKMLSLSCHLLEIASVAGHFRVV